MRSVFKRTLSAVLPYRKICIVRTAKSLTASEWLKQTSDLDKMRDRRENDVMWSADNARIISRVFRYSIYSIKQNIWYCLRYLLGLLTLSVLVG